jgi:acyl carrier protein
MLPDQAMRRNMGLDAVEILMEVEEAFDITLDDAEAEKMATPRDLIESVSRKVTQAAPSTCLTQRSFNLLRKALLQRLPLKRWDITPSVRLTALVPRSRRLAMLEELALDLNTEPLPALVRPPWLVGVLTAQSFAVGLATAFAVHKVAPEVKGSLLFWAGLAAAVLTHICAWIATTRLAKDFPPLVATIGDLARWVTAHKPDLASPTPGRWTREQVAARVREIVIDHLGCEKHYREDASFVRDLGLN